MQGSTEDMVRMQGRLIALRDVAALFTKTLPGTTNNESTVDSTPTSE